MANATRSRVSRRFSECSPPIEERCSIRARRSLLALMVEVSAAVRKLYRIDGVANNAAERFNPRHRHDLRTPAEARSLRFPASDAVHLFARPAPESST